MKGEVVEIIRQDRMEVEVVKEPNFIGYRFDAIGIESLPLAVELALIQARNMPKKEAKNG